MKLGFMIINCVNTMDIYNVWNLIFACFVFAAISNDPPPSYASLYDSNRLPSYSEATVPILSAPAHNITVLEIMPHDHAVEINTHSENWKQTVHRKRKLIIFIITMFFVVVTGILIISLIYRLYITILISIVGLGVLVVLGVDIFWN